jgi:ABC-type branched-subunit amino acid transport system ATPase component/branched-subunit amino acid ABC-type transport system permease component
MSQHLAFLLLGLANGAVFAALALALVVTYRSSGVLNFGTGAIAMLSAYFYAFLRQGKLFVPVPGLPGTIDLGARLPFVPAVAIALALTALVGLGLYVSTFRPLRAASPVAKAVASLGAMVVITGVVLLRRGSDPLVVTPIFPQGHPWAIFGAHVSRDRVWFAATVLALTAIVIVAYRFTRFGLHTRAAAESEKGAYVSHISPDRIAASNWMISAAVAGIAGILIATVSPFQPFQYTLFIVPALAAAIVGGFEVVGIAVAAGLVIGMLQSEMAYLRVQHTWLPQSGLAELVPLALVLLVLVVRGKPLPSRGVIMRAALARAPRPERFGRATALGVAVGVLAIYTFSRTYRGALVSTFIIAIIALSMVLVTGIAGQVSLAQLTLAGVSAFLLGTITTDWGVPFPFAPMLAALGASVFGVVIGLPALRIRGLPVAIVTFSMAVGVQAVWFQNIDLVGAEGKTVREPTLFGYALGPGSGAEAPRPQFCLIVLAVLVVAALCVATVRRSRLGGAMLAVRANERSAAASGINVVGTKIAAFAIAAFIAGLGGSMLAYNVNPVGPESFDVLTGLFLFGSVYLAGITSVSGGVLAGVLAADGILSFALADHFSIDPQWIQLLTGIGLIITVVKNPEGVVGNLHHALDRLRARNRPLREAAEPSYASAAPESAPPTPPVRDGIALTVRDLIVRYGGVAAVDGVSFTVSRSAIVGLIGPNGAGKTTLIDAISGFCRYDGVVELDGAALDGLPPHRRVRRGLARTFQGVELWNELTVAENVLVGPRVQRRTADEIDGLFALLQLDDLRDRPAGELSQGQRQLVSIARALIGHPKMVLLDEPAAGLDSTESMWLAARLRDIRNAGTTVLLVDHDMNLVLNLCDHIEVLDFGHVIASGAPNEIRRSSVVAEAYLGSTHAATQEAIP